MILKHGKYALEYSSSKYEALSRAVALGGHGITGGN